LKGKQNLDLRPIAVKGSLDDQITPLLKSMYRIPKASKGGSEHTASCAISKPNGTL
jgi:hypothetical protein